MRVTGTRKPGISAVLASLKLLMGGVSSLSLAIATAPLPARAQETPLINREETLFITDVSPLLRDVYGKEELSPDAADLLSARRDIPTLVPPAHASGTDDQPRALAAGIYRMGIADVSTLMDVIGATATAFAVARDDMTAYVVHETYLHEGTDAAHSLSLALQTQPEKETNQTVQHTVKAGDNLYRIALRYNVDIDRLAKENGITDVTSLQAGQVLNIPSDVQDQIITTKKDLLLLRKLTEIEPSSGDDTDFDVDPYNG